MRGLELEPSTALPRSENRLASARDPNPQPHFLSISRRVTRFVRLEFIIDVVPLEFFNPETGTLLMLKVPGKNLAKQLRALRRNFRCDFLIETPQENEERV